MISIRLIYIQNSKKNKSYQFENDLIKRLNHNIKFDLRALNHKKKFSSVEELIGYEGNLISKELDRSRTTICFDKEGDMLSSKKFSEKFFGLKSNEKFSETNHD